MKAQNKLDDENVDTQNVRRKSRQKMNKLKVEVGGRGRVRMCHHSVNAICIAAAGSNRTNYSGCYFLVPWHLFVTVEIFNYRNCHFPRMRLRAIIYDYWLLWLQASCTLKMYHLVARQTAVPLSHRSVMAARMCASRRHMQKVHTFNCVDGKSGAKLATSETHCKKMAKRVRDTD